MEKHSSINNDLTAIIQVYYQQRFKYLASIVKAILSGSVVPGRIIIWANGGNGYGSVETFAGQNNDNGVPITVIKSSDNTLMGRYAAVLVATTPYIFVQDDDLVVGHDTVGLLLDRCSSGITGISGRNLGADPRGYTDGDGVYSGFADVILGRCFVCPKSALASGINYLMRGGRPPGRADDIMFSLFAPGNNYVMPGTGCTNLDEEGVGLSHEPQHMDERDEAVAYYRAI